MRRTLTLVVVAISLLVLGLVPALASTPAPLKPGAVALVARANPIAARGEMIRISLPLGNSTTFAPLPAGSYGCLSGTKSALSFGGYTYTMVAKDCMEAYGTNGQRGHSVTKCLRSGQPYNCAGINGDTVYEQFQQDTPSGWVTIATGNGISDPDCSNCSENSHYTASCFVGATETVNYWTTMYSDQHHVVWAPGYASGWQDNYS